MANIVSKHRQALHVVLMAAIISGILFAWAKEMSAQSKPRIKLVTLGGTIAHLKKPDGTNARIQISQVMSDIRSRYPQPEVRAVLESVEFSEVEVTRVGSGSLNVEEFMKAAAEAQKAVNEGYDAVIVTHGTTTSEDTVYFLNLLVGGEIPIVLTNSQIQHMAVGNDGDLNLLSAIMVASAKSSRGKTVLVENQKILPAREVVKGSDLPGGFSAGALGPLGWVTRPNDGYTAETADRFVTYYRQPIRKARATSEFNISQFVSPGGGFKKLPRVEVIAGHYDAQPDVVDAILKLGVQGFIVTGMPPGGSAFGPQSDRLQALAMEGMPIVHTSRNSAQYQNRVNPSSSVRLEGDNLPWQKLRILVQLAMHKTGEQNLVGADRLNELQRLIDSH
ncbi:MAG TPA: asparaginase domain-containing protein [Terriglobia bacterium]|nr:asparaginase domain-containing protein [Terriglobia bacterium]